MATHNNESIFTNEERRRIDVAMRLYALEQMLPYLKETKRLACSNLEKCQTEIKDLENEREALIQGQLVFDETF